MKAIIFSAIVSLVFVLSVIAIQVVVENEKDVPAVLEDTWRGQVKEHAALVERFDELNTVEKAFNEYDWGQMTFMMNLADYLHVAVAYEITLCKNLGQGYYCEQAERHLKEAKYEIEKTKEFAKKRAHAKEI